MGILQHTWGILVSPSTEWFAIRSKQSSFLQVFFSHVPILALVPTVSAYIGVTQVGWTVADGAPMKLTSGSAATLCVLTYFALLAGTYLLGEFINWMSKTYGAPGTDQQRHYQGAALAVFVTTPIMLAGIANLYPQLWLVTSAAVLAGCYSVYLMYRGIPILMNIPKDQAFFYATSVITVGLVLLVAILITTVVIWGMGIGPIYTD